MKQNDLKLLTILLKSELDNIAFPIEMAIKSKRKLAIKIILKEEIKKEKAIRITDIIDSYFMNKNIKEIVKGVKLIYALDNEGNSYPTYILTYMFLDGEINE